MSEYFGNKQFFMIKDEGGVNITCTHWPDEKMCAECLVDGFLYFNRILSEARNELKKYIECGGAPSCNETIQAILVKLENA